MSSLFTDTSHPNRKWLVLAIVAMTQLVVVLDGTIVAISLPHAQAELHLSDVQRQWVVTAYALAFGSLLLLGGRIADFWGRKRTYIVGLAGFGIASAYGGLIHSGAELIIARGLQGVFAALMAPAALAILTITFPMGRERNTAFAIFGTTAGMGAAIGFILGGILTEYASWRWCLLVNVPIVVVAIFAAALLLTESKAQGDTKLDIISAVTVTAGLGALVYGFTLAEHGWNQLSVLLYLAGAVVLLTVFVVRQATYAHPLLPLRILNRTRSGAFLLQMIAGATMIGAMLYLTFHMQIVLQFTPLQAGLGMIVQTVAISSTVPFATKLLPKFGPRPYLIIGPIIASVGIFYLSFVTVGGSYWTQIMPALIIAGIGMALLFVPVQNIALLGVDPHDAGAASATGNASNQIGGSIGLAVFTTIYVEASAGSHLPADLVEGYHAVFRASAVVVLFGAVIAFLMIRGSKADLMPGITVKEMH
ncbi:MFS transporter [Timonella sp. A28]|uniref:MFS transporter n=1 Tax=Timonella sp. A28 TaxID=3442640 RepID=UPI003EBA8C73